MCLWQSKPPQSTHLITPECFRDPSTTEVSTICVRMVLGRPMTTTAHNPGRTNQREGVEWLFYEMKGHLRR